MNSLTTISILVADDHPYTAEGFKHIFSSKPQYSIVAVASDGQQVISILNRMVIDIVLMDVRMPVLDGIETTQIIREKFPDVKVIGVSGFDDENSMFEMVNRGAKGLILKSSETHEVFKAIDNVYSGGEYFCGKTIPILFRKMLNSSSATSEMLVHDGYSKTEIRVIKEICNQKTSKEISDSLSLSEKAISYYRHRLMEKMKVKSSIGIVLYAIKHSIVNIKDIL